MRFARSGAVACAVALVGVMSACSTEEADPSSTQQCNLHTNEIVSVPAQQKNVPDGYTTNLNLCDDNKRPVAVCNEETGIIITVTASDARTYGIYNQDLYACVQ